MATFNGAAFLQKQLRSLSSQTRLPDELVITDDGSCDETRAIIEEFASTSPFVVRLIRNENRLGYIGNFLHAADECRSDLIAFCDQDDAWHPDKLDMCVACFGDEDVMLVHHQADLIDKAGRKIGQLVHNRDRLGYGGVRPFAFALGFTEVFRASILPKRSWSDGNVLSKELLPFGHDQWVYFLAVACGKVVYLPQSLAGYRQHGGNAFGADTRRSGAGWMLSELRKEAEYWQKFASVAPLAIAVLEEQRGYVEPGRRQWIDGRIALMRDFRHVAQFRKQLYGNTNLIRRLASIGKLRQVGAYDNQLGVDQSILRDAFVAVAGPSAASAARKVFRRLSPDKLSA